MLKKLKTFVFSSVCSLLAAVAVLNTDVASILLYYEPEIPKCLEKII